MASNKSVGFKARSLARPSNRNTSAGVSVDGDADVSVRSVSPASSLQRTRHYS
jgi:hypothetical protein